jgi:DNA-binding transcriptional MerR regulator
LEDGFTAQQTSKLTNCTPHQLRYWDRVRLVQPSLQQTGGRPGVKRLYSFRDLVALRVVKSLLDNGMSVQRVRRAWDYLRRNGDIDMHLSDVELVTDGVSIFQVAHNDEESLDALREAQLAFFVALDKITRSVEDDISRFELDRERFLSMLRHVEEDVLNEVAEAGGE